MPNFRTTTHPRRSWRRLTLRISLACTGIVLTAVALIASVAPVRAAAGAANPLLAATGVREGEAAFDGRVLARLAAGSYVYHQIEVGGIRSWVVTMGEGAAEGDAVHVEAFVSREDFWSPRLARRFERLLFGTVRPM